MKTAGMGEAITLGRGVPVTVSPYLENTSNMAGFCGGTLHISQGVMDALRKAQSAEQDRIFRNLTIIDVSAYQTRSSRRGGGR